MKKILFTLFSSFSFIINSANQSATCYDYICPEGQIASPTEGSETDFRCKSPEELHLPPDAPLATKTINYKLCDNDPCNDLDVCQAYLIGQQDAQRECLDTIESLKRPETTK